MLPRTARGLVLERDIDIAVGDHGDSMTGTWREWALRVGTVRVLGVGLMVLGVSLPWLVGRGFVDGGREVQLRPALVRLPPGTFMMGSSEEEAGLLTAAPEHWVTLTHEFSICQTEVTQAQWMAVTGDNPSDCAYGCGPKLPVHNVSWEMAVEYLNRLSEMEELDACYEKLDGTWSWDRSCDGYRLPTEAEWEYATRAGTKSAYSFGDDTSRLGEYAWFYDDSGGKTHQVKRKEPNPWGLYDVHGNVWEWVWDLYEEGYGEVARTDPAGPKTGEYPVTRGGSFIDVARWLRSTVRSRGSPISVNGNYGLRCARGPHPSAGVP